MNHGGWGGGAGAGAIIKPLIRPYLGLIGAPAPPPPPPPAPIMRRLSSRRAGSDAQEACQECLLLGQVCAGVCAASPRQGKIRISETPSAWRLLGIQAIVAVKYKKTQQDRCRTGSFPSALPGTKRTNQLAFARTLARLQGWAKW